MPQVVENRLVEICLSGVLVILAIGKDGVPGGALFWFGVREFFLKTCVPLALDVIFKTGLLKWPSKGEMDRLGAHILANEPLPRKSDGFSPFNP